LRDLFTWQVGAERPPSVCLNCGAKFDDGEHKMRGPYPNSPYMYVCERCWQLPFLWFEDKAQTLERWAYRLEEEPEHTTLDQFLQEVES
jgi:DNA-directed RNA polymerase subunit RPC12/RpoP